MDGAIGPDTLIVGIGEALFDCFAHATRLGGAPVNFAVHAHQLLAPHGGQAAVVSRVGNDSLGGELLQQLGSRRLVTRYIQCDPKLATGVVNVVLDDHGQPTYEIAENVAWDHMEWQPELGPLAQRCNAVCFGTLAQRSEVSRATIQRFLAEAGTAIRLFDVNLRQHYYDPEVLVKSLHLATDVKLSSEELATVGELTGVMASSAPADETAGALCEEFEIRLLALTRGADGTVIYSGKDRFEGNPAQFPLQPGADSVGAGDACCAGVLYGLLAGWPPEQTLELANRMGAFVASQPGATPQLPDDLVV